MNRVASVEDKIGDANMLAGRVIPNFQINSEPARLPASFRDIQAEKATSQLRIASSSPSSSSSSLSNTSDAESYSGDRKTTKKIAARKPSDKPKRPLSAYNIFFQHERERILRGANFDEETPDAESAANKILLHKILSLRKGQGRREQTKKREHVKTHGKIGFVQLAKTVGARWKGLDDASRAVYTALAVVEKTRYKKEVDLWNKKRVVDAELEIVKTEARKETLHMHRVMQKSRGIFDDVAVEDTTDATTSSSTDRRSDEFTAAHAAQPISSSVSASSSIPLRMSHTELMEKCRANLAAMSTATSRASSSNDEVETDMLPNHSSLSAKESSQPEMSLPRVREEASYCATDPDHDTVHSMHAYMNNAGGMASSSCGESAAIHQSAVATVYSAAPNNAALLPLAARACANADDSSVCDEDLHHFLSQSKLCEDLRHPSFASVDKEMTDFLNWAFQDLE